MIVVQTDGLSTTYPDEAHSEEATRFLTIETTVNKANRQEDAG